MDEPNQPDDTGWLDEGLTEASDSGLTVQGGELGVKKPQPSKYAVDLDLWGKRRGNDLAKTAAMKELNLPAEDCADMHAMAFEVSPELVEECTNADKLQFLKMLEQNPDYQALHNDTMLDDLAAELATLQYSRQYVELVKRREEEKQKQEQQKGKGKKGKKQQDGEPGQPTPEEELAQEMQAMAAANKAIAAASQEVEELRDMQDALGIGKDGQSSGINMSPAQMKNTFQKLKNDRTLRLICEMAGRYRRMARAKQREKTTHGYDDMIGIELGAELAHLLPNELVALCHPILKLDALRRFVERQMMQREYRGIKRVAKGPIIVAIDESGSMSGHKIIQAKALALAMAWVARHQNRWCGLVSWATKSQVRWLALPPNKWPTSDVMNWLSQFYNGAGTHLPVERMPEIYNGLGAQQGKTDVIIITDGETDHIGPGEMAAFKRWKQEAQAKLIGISIESQANVLQSISDEFFLVNNLEVDNEAVERAVSV